MTPNGITFLSFSSFIYEALALKSPMEADAPPAPPLPLFSSTADNIPCLSCAVGLCRVLWVPV